MSGTEGVSGAEAPQRRTSQNDRRKEGEVHEDDGRNVSLEGPMDSTRTRRLYRKLDLRIIPPFWVLYFLCSAVRSNVGLAQTMNIKEGHDLASELSLTPKQVSTGLALFYVCYVLFDLPSNLVMSRVSPHAWMSRIVISVAIIGMCFTAVKAAWSF